MIVSYSLNINVVPDHILFLRFHISICLKSGGVRPKCAIFSGIRSLFGIYSESGLQTQTEKRDIKCPDLSIKPLEQFRPKNNKIPNFPQKATTFPQNIDILADKNRVE
jgi:hypothetical protein